MAEHNDKGQWGERLAAEYLERKGFRILWRDWRDGHRDLDIVAVDADQLVVVEVKTRRAGSFLAPELAVDARKRRALRRAADAFLGAMRERPRASRLDVVEVYVSEADGSMRAVHHRALSWRGARR